jgi:hypothetical protein
MHRIVTNTTTTKQETMMKHALMTGFATVEGHFVSRKHVVKALAADGVIVLTRPERGRKPELIAVGKLLGDRPTKMLTRADGAGIERRNLDQLLFTRKTRTVLKKSLLTSGDHLEPAEKLALEALTRRKKKAS